MAEKDTKMSPKEKEELAAYRKESRYFGYEDYTPSGRAALAKYFEEEKKSGFAKGDKKDTVRERNTPAYSKSAAEKAKQTQKEYADEMKRETRGKADSSEFAKGGLVKANCGASVPPAQKAKK